MVQDMYSQAQSAQAPAAAPEQDELGQDSKALEMGKAFMGMPEGNSAEEIAQKITMTLEQAGIMEQSTEPEKLQQAIQEFAVAVEAKDIEAIKASPILALFSKYQDQLAGGMPQEAEAPTQPTVAPQQDPMAMAQQAQQGMPAPGGGITGV